MTAYLHLHSSVNFGIGVTMLALQQSPAYPIPVASRAYQPKYPYFNRQAFLNRPSLAGPALSKTKRKYILRFEPLQQYTFVYALDN